MSRATVLFEALMPALGLALMLRAPLLPALAIAALASLAVFAVARLAR
jgi:hypothetical protein